jgi:hypothetical protein
VIQFMNRSLIIVGLIAVAFAASGCESARKAFGGAKSAPDEFVVYKRPPLTLPPEYGLRPPKPGADRPQRVSPRDEARTAVLKPSRQIQQQQRQSKQASSPGMSALLNKTGAHNADPSIREKVDDESTVLSKEDRRFIDKLIFWVDDAPHPGTVVDPKKEQQRIMQNQALGKPINDGKVPEIKRKAARKGILDF